MTVSTYFETLPNWNKTVHLIAQIKLKQWITYEETATVR